MNNKLIFLPFLLCACADPNLTSTESDSIIEAEEKESIEEGSETDVPQEETEETVEETEESNPQEEIEDVESSEETTTDFAVESGIWGVSEAILLEDTCDWDTQLRSFFGMGSDALLPKDFTVEGFEGSFAIEANAYGASGPIVCTLNEDLAFSCEEQSVTPVDYDLGSMDPWMRTES